MTTIAKMDELIDYIRSKRVPLVPCTEEEIEALETTVGKRLPPDYRRFLRAMGRSAGPYFVGSDCFYAQLPDLTHWGRELLAENRFRLLPEDAFVFWMHQGYQFAFIRLDTYETQPQVYYFIEGRQYTEFETQARTIADFYARELYAHERLAAGQIRS